MTKSCGSGIKVDALGTRGADEDVGEGVAGGFDDAGYGTVIAGRVDAEVAACDYAGDKERRYIGGG